MRKHFTYLPLLFSSLILLGVVVFLLSNQTPAVVGSSSPEVIMSPLAQEVELSSDADSSSLSPTESSKKSLLPSDRSSFTPAAVVSAPAVIKAKSVSISTAAITTPSHESVSLLSDARLNSAFFQSALLKQATGLHAHVLQLAIKAFESAEQSHVAVNKPLITVIDYSLPSTQKRLWVIDLQHDRVLKTLLVAHGQGSGNLNATHFSNNNSSHQTSLGLFLTGNTYTGSHGESLRLNGLDQGFNDHAFNRAIVVHGAWYVSDDMIKKTGRLGRSFGCPAVALNEAKPLIETIKEGSLIFAYYPDANWLKSSQFLR